MEQIFQYLNWVKLTSIATLRAICILFTNVCTSNAQIQKSTKFKKAQMSTLDFVFSIAIFTVLLVILYSSWFSKVQSTSSQLETFKASVACDKALKSLTEYSGFPSSWGALNLSPNSNSLKGIGIADSHLVIDKQKLEVLEYYFNRSETYKNSTEKMGIAPYDADIRIYYQNGTNVSIMGDAPTSKDSVLYTSQRLATYEDNAVLVRVRIWD